MNEEMKKAMAGKAMPELAIVDNNTLAALGLKGLLESAIPMVSIFLPTAISSSRTAIVLIPSCSPLAMTSTPNYRVFTASAPMFRKHSSSSN